MQKIKNFWIEHPKLLITVGITVQILMIAKRYFNGGLCKVTRDINDKIVIITGANCGIGYVTALQLAKLGAQVILACRDYKRVEPLFQLLKKNNCKVQFIQLDLADLQSIKDFVDQFQKQFNQLDILINNAGVMSIPFRCETRQNIELQFGTNHIGHFYLTSLLSETLKRTKQSRVINVSSKRHDNVLNIRGHIYFEDINFENNNYHPDVAYAQSKLANILFTKELQQQFIDQGADVKVVALHPGVVRTELMRYILSENLVKKLMIKVFLYPIYYMLTKSCYYGAQTTLYCALEQYDKLTPGGYYADCKLTKSSQESYDINVQKKLWTVSQQMIDDQIVKMKLQQLKF